MSQTLSQFCEKITAVWSKVTTLQRVFSAVLAFIVVIAFGVMVYWVYRPEYQVLYSRLYPEDANTIVKILQAEKVPYKLADNGTTIFVSGDKVYNLRLKIAEEGSLNSQEPGFGIFDGINAGQTNFNQHINYQRALQDELARTISEFPQVERARVHLVLPHKRLFVGEQAWPSASVLLKMALGKKLSDKNIEGIVNFVALAVEGMDSNMITIFNTKGEVLYSPKGLVQMGATSSTQLEHKLLLEKNLEDRIEQMFMPVYGAGRVIAKVNAELDFSRKTTRIEEYDPDVAVVRSEQRSEETQTGQANINNGSPEPNFRGDGVGGAISNQQGTRESRTTSFELNKTEHEVISSLGELTRLSVAVIIDGTYKDSASEADGEMTAGPARVFVQRSDEERAQVRSLVSTAVGLDEQRGDTIEVSSMAFNGPEFEIEPGTPDVIINFMARFARPFLAAVFVFLFLVLIVRPVVMALIRPKAAPEGVTGLPEGQGVDALLEADESENIYETRHRLDGIRAQAMQLSEQNMDAAMAIIKTWLKQEESLT